MALLTKLPLILGSASLSRQEILHNAGYDFSVLKPDIDEKAIRTDDLELLPILIAKAKADALLPLIKEPALLITSDNVVICNGELREKPESKAQARAFIESHADYPGQTNTAVVVTNTKTGLQFSGLDSAKVYLEPIPEHIIDKLLAKGDVMYVSGAMLIEDPLMAPYIEYIDGTMESIRGMPLHLLVELLKAAEQED